jgi:hypothetical protein
MFAKLVSMAKTPEEVQQDMADMPAVAPAGKISGPKYPYGLCLSLDDESLEKLGLDGDLPEVGEVLQFSAIARVTSASMNEHENGAGASDTCCRVELQITDMGVPAANPAEVQVERSAARRKRFYPNMVDDDESE